MKTKEQKSADNKERYWWYKNRGLCPYCGRRYIEPGLYGCKQCVSNNRRHQKKYDPDGSKQYAMNKARRTARREAGLCIDCGAEANGKCRCPRCAAMQRDRHRAWVVRKKLDEQAVQARRNTNT